MRIKNSIPILVADDDRDDCEMIKEALVESRLMNQVHFVHDGEALLNYLQSSHTKEKPMPGLILLDLNMPKKDGREALKEIKENPKLRHIPVVILTTSKAEEDIVRTYNLGVNSFITKPIAFDELVKIMTGLGNYWFEIVALPENLNGDDEC